MNTLEQRIEVEKIGDEMTKLLLRIRRLHKKSAKKDTTLSLLHDANHAWHLENNVPYREQK